MEEFSFAFASPQDESAIKHLLSKCQLPTDGIGLHLEHFIVAKSKDELLGVVGLETYDNVGLLRSLAIIPGVRRKGVGKDLCIKLIAHAYTQNIDELFLLTTTAEKFFAKLGFQKIGRELAPAPLKSSVEFQKLCLDSAVCMAKPLRHQAIYFPREILTLKPDVPGASMWGVALDKTLLTFFEVEPHSRFDRHNHESEQITMVLEGELFFELDSGTHCVRKGEVIAIPSNISHAVFTLDQHVKAIDAWSPVMPQYVRPNKTLQPTRHTAPRG
jgi:N-acetylglutamate synthase-like GNAT family acetyltransferase/mannose-6-phosphate isomerase-like protein (cupin superfamily)